MNRGPPSLVTLDRFPQFMGYNSFWVFIVNFFASLTEWTDDTRYIIRSILKSCIIGGSQYDTNKWIESFIIRSDRELFPHDSFVAKVCLLIPFFVCLDASVDVYFG